MRRSRHAVSRLAATTTLSLFVGLATLALAPSPAHALPPPASGSKCSASWVNNAGAMSCFIQGQDDIAKGVAHPHYVACLGGDIFCCTDNDNGNQNCEAQAAGHVSTRGQQVQ